MEDNGNRTLFILSIGVAFVLGMFIMDGQHNFPQQEARADYVCTGGSCSGTPTPGPCCGYKVIQDEKTPLPQRTALNCVGDGVTCADDGFNHVTTLTVPGGYSLIKNKGAPITKRNVINWTSGVTCGDNPLATPPSSDCAVTGATVSVIAPIQGDGSVGNPLNLGTLLEGQKIQLGGASVSAGTMRLLGDVGSQFGPISNSGSVETTAFTYTVPASAFDTNGKWLRIMSAGRLGSNANTKKIALHYGPFGNVVTCTTTTADKAWVAQAVFMRAGTTMSVGSAFCLVGGSLPEVQAGAPATVFDFTTPFPLTITLTGSSTGDVTGDYATLEFANR